MILQWIPAHCGIIGNEKADEAAKRGLRLRNVRNIFFTKHDASRLAKELVFRERSTFWSLPENQHPFLHHVDPTLALRLPERLPRQLETLLHRLRLNVAFTNTYRYRLGLTSNPYCDNCGSPETVEHILLECPTYGKERNNLAQKIECLNHSSLTLKALLGPWPPTERFQSAECVRAWRHANHVVRLQFVATVYTADQGHSRTRAVISNWKKGL